MEIKADCREERSQLLAALERAAARAWPATVQRSAPGGWLLRATPGLHRGRSNHALPPCRELSRDELPAAIERVGAFARRHAIRAGIQVSPLECHASLQSELDLRGWTTNLQVLVMTREVAALRPPDDPVAHRVLIERHATAPWRRAWARCEPGCDVQAHARTVFGLMQGRAWFARIGQRAVAIGVEDRGLLGLFCVAVAPAQRRRGLARAIVAALLARTRATIAYLQVEQANAPAVSMYEHLGFAETYRYLHRNEAG